MPNNEFKIGVEYVSLRDQGGYFIASKEKALVDLVYPAKGITSKEKLRFFLFEQMRIDPDLFENLN